MRWGLVVIALAAACSSPSRMATDMAGQGFDGGAVDMALPEGDPTTCEEAAINRSYLGCEFWPTVTPNPVWEVFDFAVVVTNPGATAADVMVTGPNGFNQNATVAPGGLTRIFLPWVSQLKGPEFNSCGSSQLFASSGIVNQGAYQLVSSRPVSVYQFSPLEYKTSGGPPGKSWAGCLGDTPCAMAGNAPIGCFSFSNDASLLLPTTALTGNYRITGIRSGAQTMGIGMSAFCSITAFEDGTDVTMQVSQTGNVLVGSGVDATGPGQTLLLPLLKGDVVRILGASGSASDLSGTVVQSTKPIQIICGIPCGQNPDGAQACDHMEEAVFPAETFGKRYVVTAPSGPLLATAAPYSVRFFGNVDGTTLSYNPSVAGAPTTLNAGEVVELTTTTKDFEVTSSQPFAVGMVQQGASIVDPTHGAPVQKGDPAFSFATAVEQYRKSYVFLAPDDYDVNFVDVVAQTGTQLVLDGQSVTASSQAIGTSGFDVWRVKLTAGQNGGAHRLTANAPMGIQVIGYGAYTSYQYPGGLDLRAIAPPPPPIQ